MCLARAIILVYIKELTFFVVRKQNWTARSELLSFDYFVKEIIDQFGERESERDGMRSKGCCGFTRLWTWPIVWVSEMKSHRSTAHFIYV